MHRFDDLDMQLLYELSADSSISVPVLSKKIHVNPSVIYSRIKRMTKKGLIKRFTIEIDDSLLGIGVRAMGGSQPRSQSSRSRFTGSCWTLQRYCPSRRLPAGLT